MGNSLFSSSLPDFNNVIENPALQDSLNYLKSIIDKFRVVVWDDKHIGVPIKIRVELPSLRNHEEIEIQSLEPVVIVFNLLEYPSKAPIVHTDRLDFPKDR
ncbi:MAG: thiamine biosynthesis protein ThiF, partial [Cyclobacteriaceae bacterium]